MSRSMSCPLTLKTRKGYNDGQDVSAPWTGRVAGWCTVWRDAGLGFGIVGAAVQPLVLLFAMRPCAHVTRWCHCVT